MMKKSILVYAHYYTPDVASTGQIISELVEGLCDTFDITVICVVPSYTGTIDKQYKKQKFYREEIRGVQVLRVRVPEFRKSNKISRIKNIIAYYFGAKRATRMLDDFDYVFTISQPPILGGLLGVYGKKKKKAKLVYNIQDLNPEQVLAVGYSGNRLITSLMLSLDKYSCIKSDVVVTVGRDLVEAIARRFYTNVPRIELINNWIDEEAVHPLSLDNPKVLEFKKKYGLDDKFIIMYSGNIGLYYDLENLLKVISLFNGARTTTGKEVVFAFIGGGSVLDKLIQYVEENQLVNVKFIPYQPKDQLIYSLNAANVHWCVNASGIKGVSCPSKYYGLAAVGKPILGVLERGSEIATIIEETRGGLLCDPGDYEAVEKNIRWFIEHSDDKTCFEMGKRSRSYLVANFAKRVAIQKYKDLLQEL